MSQYSFPVLDDNDMVSFLNDIGFPFQPAWKKPTQPMVTEIYTNLVDIVVGIEKDRLTRPEYAIMEQHGIHQDVYTKGLPELGMLMVIFQLMDSCCVFNFSLRDITTPSWARLRTILSGVINFVRFQHEFFNAYDSAVEKTRSMEEKKEDLLKTVQKLTIQYEEHVGSPEVQLLRQLEQQEEALEQELAAKRREREILEDDFRAEGAKLKLISAKVVGQDETIKGLSYKLDLLKSKDVSGLLHDVENLRAKVEVQEKMSEIGQKDLTILRSKHEINLKFFRSLESIYNELQDYIQSSQIYQETINKVTILQKSLKNTKNKNKNLEKTKDELSEKSILLKNELLTISQRHDDLIKSKQDNIQILIKEKRDVELEDRENKLKIDKIEFEIIQIENDIKKIISEHNQILDDAIRRIILLHEAVDKFHSRIVDSFSQSGQQSIQLETPQSSSLEIPPVSSEPEEVPVDGTDHHLEYHQQQQQQLRLEQQQRQQEQHQQPDQQQQLQQKAQFAEKQRQQEEQLMFNEQQLRQIRYEEKKLEEEERRKQIEYDEKLYEEQYEQQEHFGDGLEEKYQLQQQQLLQQQQQQLQGHQSRFEDDPYYYSHSGQYQRQQHQQHQPHGQYQSTGYPHQTPSHHQQQHHQQQQLPSQRHQQMSQYPETSHHYHQQQHHQHQHVPQYQYSNYMSSDAGSTGGGSGGYDD